MARQRDELLDGYEKVVMKAKSDLRSPDESEVEKGQEFAVYGDEAEFFEKHDLAERVYKGEAVHAFDYEKDPEKVMEFEAHQRAKADAAQGGVSEYEDKRYEELKDKYLKEMKSEKAEASSDAKSDSKAEGKGGK